MPVARTTERTHRYRSPLILLGALALLAALALSANPIVRATTGYSVGTLIAQRDGHLINARYQTPADVPAGDLPSWFPEDGTSIAVGRPGPKAGLDGAVRVDAAVPAQRRAPAGCTSSAVWSMPFVVPDEWPTFGVRDLLACGDWTLAIHPGHWYLWSATATATATGAR